MITPKEIELKTMSLEKRAEAKHDLFAFYIGRPLSYVLTVPFLYINISPNAVSLLSLIPVLIGFILMSVGTSKTLLLLGWLMFFIWNLLDGVDGNIARYKKEYSKYGSVYDAMSGYFAMVLSYFAWGIAAAHNRGILSQSIVLSGEVYIILGALSGIAVIFPRLVMHKALNMLDEKHDMDDVRNKKTMESQKLLP